MDESQEEPEDPEGIGAGGAFPRVPYRAETLESKLEHLTPLVQQHIIASLRPLRELAALSLSILAGAAKRMQLQTGRTKAKPFH